MIALTAAPPGALMYSGANVRVHTALIKANALHGSALAAAIKGFQRRYVYVCLRAAEAEISLSVSTSVCMQMHQIKCNYTRRKFTLGLHPIVLVSFAQNSTSDKLQRDERARESEFFYSAGGGTVESEFGLVCLLRGPPPLQSISARSQLSPLVPNYAIHTQNNVRTVPFVRRRSSPRAFGCVV